jgi:drug/metabolite transporter (DMT)-like permease
MYNLVLMVLMALLWAGAFVVGKLSVSAVPPEVVAFLRFFAAGLVLVGIMAVREPSGLRLCRRDWPLVLGLGATGIAGYNILFFRGLQAGLASDGAMIIPTLNPLLILLLAALFLGEPLTGRKLLGAAISLTGQGLIFASLLAAAAQNPDRLRGDLYFVASAVCWALYGVLGRVAARRLTPLAATTWASLAGAVMLAPFAAWVAPGSTGYTPIFWADILYLALGATVAGFLLWSRGIHTLGAGRTAAFVNLVPVFTLVLAALVLGEKPTWVQVGGMLLVLSGVYLAGTAPARQ